MYVRIKSMYCEPLARKQKNEGANLAIDSLLRGGHLRLPMSLTIAVVTLRALGGGLSSLEGGNKKTREPTLRLTPS